MPLPKFWRDTGPTNELLVSLGVLTGLAGGAYLSYRLDFTPLSWLAIPGGLAAAFAGAAFALHLLATHYRRDPPEAGWELPAAPPPRRDLGLPKFWRDCEEWNQALLLAGICAGLACAGSVAYLERLREVAAPLTVAVGVALGYVAGVLLLWLFRAHCRRDP